MADKLDAAIAKVLKSYDLRVATLDSFVSEVDSISTGNVAIDAITGVGGLPRGRIVELYGPPSCGKTTTALQTAVEAQKRDLMVVYFDYEHAIDLQYARALGLDTAENFMIAQPDSLEQGMNAARELVGTGEVGVMIFDSIAAMVPEKELDVETGKSTFALQAKQMAQACRQITGLLHTTNTLAIFLNHLQDVIDATPMGQKLSAQGVKRKSTPGGKALKFYASMRLEYKPIGGVRESRYDAVKNEDVDVVSQQKVEVTVVKNKVGPPMYEAEVRVVFGKGFSQAFSVLQILTSHGYIKKESGGVHRFTPENQPPSMDIAENPKANWIRGEAAVIEVMEQYPDWLADLTVKAKEIIGGPSNGR